MGKVMNMQEIRDKFTGEWVLISYEELDEDLNVRRGEVLAHSVHRDEIYQQLLSLKGKKVAIEYLGKIPEDWAVVL
jgi:hypothetical protein